jgi:hypothetical protein
MSEGMIDKKEPDERHDTAAADLARERRRAGSGPPLQRSLALRRMRALVGPGGCAAVAVLLVVIMVLAGFLGALRAERAVRQLFVPPTATIVPTPDIRPLGAGPVSGPPSITVDQIRRILTRYGSPALDDAQAFYDLGAARGIDPAYCVAFFIMESAAGTQGVARTTHSIGNLRALSGQPSFEGYRQYASWQEGIADWYRLIDEVYIRDLGLTTVDAIVPVYAPASDNNDPEAYIYTVKRLVAGWRGY